MKMLDGKALSLKIQEELKPAVEALKIQNIMPRLVIISIAPGDTTEMYLEQKKKFGQAIGAEVKIVRLPFYITQEELTGLVRAIGCNKKNHGIVLQLPLPPLIKNVDSVLDVIPYEQDVDTLSGARLVAVFRGRSSILPPIVAGVKKLLEEASIEISKKKITIVGAGKLTGRPFEIWLILLWIISKAIPHNICVVTEKTDEIFEYTQKADLIFTGTGIPWFIKPEMVKENVIIIDAGTKKDLKDGTYKGDVDPAVYDKTSFYTPVPGGVGPLTVAYLFYNLIKLIEEKRQFS